MKKLAIVLVLVLSLAATVTIISACSVKYDLVYANWNFGTDSDPSVERKMIEEFEKDNNVKIKMVDYGQGQDYPNGLVGALQRHEMPDVFMVNNMSFVLNYQLARDVSDFVANDEDWEYIPETVEQGAHFKAGIYAIPFALHMLGYFMNEDLIEDNQLSSVLPKDIDSKGISYDQFNQLVNGLSITNNFVGLTAENSVYEWYPASANKNYGYFGWSDAEKKYYINTPEFARGISETKRLYNAHSSFGSLTEAKKAQLPGIDSDVKAWDNGKVGLRWGYTYEVPNMLDNDAFKIRFVGIPYMDDEGARNQGYSCLVPDYLAIYKDTPNAELAYKFAKWMSFDPKGIAKRIELASDGETPNTLPMTTDPDILSDFEDVYPIKGVVPFYERLADSIFEPTKVVPGYDASRFTSSTGLAVTGADGVKKDNAKIGEFLDACFSGDGVFAEHAADLEILANQAYADDLSDYESRYK